MTIINYRMSIIGNFWDNNVLFILSILGIIRLGKKISIVRI